jgi:hypothetical protein
MITTANAVINTYVEVATTLPRERLPYGGRSQVMEILKVQIIETANLTWTQTAATAGSTRIYLTTASFGTTEPAITASSGKVISFKRVDLLSVAAAPAASYQITDFTDIVDLTDGAGHGVLVATDNIFLGTIQTSAAVPVVTGNVAMRILYRWKNVGLQEYIGIVQSQQ